MKHRLVLDPANHKPPTRDHDTFPSSLPTAKHTHAHPTKPSSGTENATLYFVGNATTLLEWSGARIMTDPNFLHAGDHVHLGPGVTGTRLKDPSIDLHELPRVDAVLLSHYHEDHFDKKVEASLRRDLPIITTPHAKHHLSETKGSGEAFTSVFDLDFFENMLVEIKPVEGVAVPAGKRACVRVTGMPGKHVPPGPAGLLKATNDFLGMVPPTNGWMVELGYASATGEGDGDFKSGYRIYISGDTLMVDELKEIPERYKDKKIDLMLIHLGGTSIPGPNMPLLMVTMDAVQGLQLVQLINPDLTLPIHFDDYDVFKSPLEDFKKAMEQAGLSDKVVYWDRGEGYKFEVKVPT